MRSFRLSPAAYRRVTWFALVALVFIIVTGGAVRLTGSGLGCSDWPTCEQDQLVAPLEFHPMVEFVNRTITGLVSVAVVLAVLGSLARVPRRRDLTWLSVGLVAGVVGQIVLGGITVLFDLWPPLVMGHFVLSMVLVANAVVLHHRAGQPGPAEDGAVAEGPAEDGAVAERAAPGAVVAPQVRALSRWMLVAAALAVLTGTVVTGAGPHGGDEDVDRLPFVVADVARIHGVAVVVFGACVLGLLALLTRTRVPAELHRQGRILLTVAVAQSAVGYTQYFTGVPVVLVGVHIFGAVVVWSAALRFHLHLASPPPDPAPSARDASRPVPAVA